MKKILDRIMEYLTATLMAVMVIVASWQVFTRFVLDDPSTISEEMLRYSLIWLTMVGSALAYSKKKHVAIVFVTRKFSGKMYYVVNIAVEIIVILFSVFILLFGGINALQNAVGQVSSAMQMPMEYLYLSLSVGGILFILYAIFHIIDHVKSMRNETGAETGN